MSVAVSGPSSNAAREVTRRDFLIVATGAVGVVGSAFALWPFIDSMNPAADQVALSTIEMGLSSIEAGQRVTVQWQGKPVFIVGRTPAEIAAAAADDPADLIDP